MVVVPPMLRIVWAMRGMRGSGAGIVLDERIDRLRNTTPAFEKVANYQAREWKKQFISEGTHLTGEKWSPLSPGYRKWKAAHFPGQPILVRTGRLRRSLTMRPLGIEEFSRNRVRLGTDVEYARFHQRGTKFMPQRQLWNTRAMDREAKDIKKIMNRWINEGRA